MRKLAIKTIIYRRLLRAYKKKYGFFNALNLEILLIAYSAGNLLPASCYNYPMITNHKRYTILTLLKSAHIAPMQDKGLYHVTEQGQEICKQFMIDFAAKLAPYKIKL